MPDRSPSEITDLLARSEVDGERVLEDLLPLVYDELRAMAHGQLRREGRATLQTTDLVHEAYCNLVGSTQVTRRGRAYFFAAASRAMRQVLVQAARRRARKKRGGGVRAETLDENVVVAVQAGDDVEGFASDLIALDEALSRMGEVHPRAARLVEARFFGGLSVEETAEALEVAARTVRRDWAWARAWLQRELDGSPSATEPER